MNYRQTITKSVFFLFFSLFFLHASGQHKNITLNPQYNHLTWSEFVQKAEAEYNIRFFYFSDSIPDTEISFTGTNPMLGDVLENHFLPHNIQVSFDGNGNVFLLKNNKIMTELPERFFINRNYNGSDSVKNGNGKNGDYLQTTDEYLTSIKTVGKKNQDSKTTATIRGYVENAQDGTPIVGATLRLEETGKIAVSNHRGFYSMTVKKGTYTLIIRSVESDTEKYELRVYSDGTLDFYLNKKIISLDDIVVKADRFDNVRSTQMGFEKISAKQISEIPLALGEKDIVRVTLLLPGIQTVGETSSGFNVRGSPADQNLFYINHVPIYNTSHLLGFFSAFNSDAIDEFTLYKSNIPTKYGGRLASIFEIKAKQGNQKKFSARGGLSPITGRILVEGPLVKDKAGYLIGLRSTYSDWLLTKVKNRDIKNSSAKFSDAITNINYKINDNNSLKLFGYYSTDYVNLAGDNLYDYENGGGALSWNHIIKNKHNLSLHLVHSLYNFRKENSEKDISSSKLNYGLSHTEFRSSLALQTSNDHNVKLGLSSTLYQFDYGSFLPLSGISIIEPKYFRQEKAVESGFYISDEWDVSDNFSVNFGLRFNNYTLLGSQDVYIYPENQPRIRNNIIDTLHFSKNELVKSYNNLDFRVAAKYMLTDNISVKGSYNRLHQYLFMLSNTIAISPTNKWKLCDYHIEPMKSNQYSVGFFTNLADNVWELSVEAYFKDIKNLVEYKDGANLDVNEIPETDVLQGDLDAYGVEFMVKKPYGRLNGWFNYTYSNASVMVNGGSYEQRINFGLTYPANYDKPHAFNLVLNYKFKRRFSISANVVYSTGRPITYPVAIYYQNGMQILHYSKRNEYRVPDYFRADLSVKIEGSLKRKKFAHGTWLFSVYNLTGRDNAFSVFYKMESGYVNGYKMSIFAVPIFSVSYNFKLGNYAD